MPTLELSYAQQRAQTQQLFIRETLRTLPDSCGAFIRAIEPQTTPLTRSAYVRDLRLFLHFLTNEVPRFGSIDPVLFSDADFNAITVDHIALFNEYLTLYARQDDRTETNQELSKMRKLSTLRSYFAYMFKTARIDRNVALLIDLPKIREKPILRLEIDEMARLLDIAETGDALSERQQKWHERTKARDLAILSLFLGTGIRVSELVGIDIQDVDMELGGFLVTRKGGDQVVLYFPDEVARVLEAYLRERNEIEALAGHQQALFLSMQRRRITVRAVENLVKKYAILAAPLKKKISPHKLRSTFGTNLYHETGDIYLVADVLGHSDVNTTKKHYAAMTDDRRRAAARVVKLREED